MDEIQTNLNLNNTNKLKDNIFQNEIKKEIKNDNIAKLNDCILNNNNIRDIIKEIELQIENVITKQNLESSKSRNVLEGKKVELLRNLKKEVAKKTVFLIIY